MKSIVKKIKIWNHHPHDSERKRLQEAVIGQFDELPSRKSVKRAIQNGNIFVNNKPSKTSTWVSLGDEIRLTIKSINFFNIGQQKKSEISKQITVVYEDDFIAIVVKPGGLVTNGNMKLTLEKLASIILISSILPDKHDSPKTAHRIDKSTHGLVIVSKTISASKALNSSFSLGKIKKQYKALVQGNMTFERCDIRVLIDSKHATTWTQKTGILSWPIHGETTFINIDLKTGRTHQIRRHLSMIGHTIVGEEIYHSGIRFSGQGLFLACTELSFPHPNTGEIISFTTKLPRKFKRILSKLNLS